VTALCFRFAQASERDHLEELQRRASLVYEAYRTPLLANPGAVHLPLSQVAEQRVRVAEEQGAVRGFSVVLPRGEVCDLDGLFVEPDHWKRGIGRALMKDAFTLGRAGGARVMEVVANPQSEGFYVRLGFARTGLVTTAFGIASKMRCSLHQTGRQT
jgi:GNAT superfamily N-acetyltransferase